MGAVFMVGDVRERLADIGDGTVDLVMSSPPFLALRSYLPEGHADKDAEIGSEPDPGTFVDVLCGVVDDLVRVLAPHGSIVFELGDTYSGSGGGGGDYLENGLREGQPGFGGSASKQKEGNAAHWRAKNQPDAVWPRAKSLALVPELFRITLAYGTNPLTGTVWWEGKDRWMVRNVVRWVRPNPPVGALGDKFRPATSELVVFTRNPKRFFDLDAVRAPLAHSYTKESGRLDGNKRKDKPDGGWNTLGDWNPDESSGAPPLDWWKLSSKGYPGAHYATYPAELCVIPIKAMCPEKVCRDCGEPSRRIVGDTPEYAEFKANNTWDSGGLVTSNLNRPPFDFQMDRVTTVGWSNCGHDNWRAGLVLDPFAGTGTTLLVATGHGRNAIGIDLDERNAELAEDRVGPLLLEVVGDTTPTPQSGHNSTGNPRFRKGYQRRDNDGNPVGKPDSKAYGE